jgi:hypothetical protein
MHPLTVITSFVTTLQIAAAVKFHPGVNYITSKLSSHAAGTSCLFPGNFTIENLVWWTPSAARNSSTPGVLDFDFADSATQLTTTCHYNSSSPAANPGGNTPRYACDDPTIEFIWEASKNLLDVIERLCPDANGYVNLDQCSESATHRLTEYMTARALLRCRARPSWLWTVRRRGATQPMATDQSVA